MTGEREFTPPESALSDYLQQRFGSAGIESINAVGTGSHATGYKVRLRGSQPLFLRTITPIDFGHDLPSDRAGTMLEAAHHHLPHSLKTHAVLGITSDGIIIDMLNMSEVATLGEFLPQDATSFCEELRSFSTSSQDTDRLAERVEPKALAMADIHSERFFGSEEASRSLYKRSLRRVIHNDELAAGVMDLIDFTSSGWIAHEEAVRFLADMERARYNLGVNPERVTRIHGDFWANNIYFSDSLNLIVTDGRLVWGEPAIDAGWMIGEFLMQDLIRFGHFGDVFTNIANKAINHYLEKRDDPDILRFMGLPYAFQALAEAYFTPHISDEQRRLLLATAFGALKNTIQGNSFEFNMVNNYTSRGLELLSR